jgi:hypothetical protein
VEEKIEVGDIVHLRGNNTKEFTVSYIANFLNYGRTYILKDDREFDHSAYRIRLTLVRKAKANNIQQFEIGQYVYIKGSAKNFTTVYKIEQYKSDIDEYTCSITTTNNSGLVKLCSTDLVAVEKGFKFKFECGEKTMSTFSDKIYTIRKKFISFSDTGVLNATYETINNEEIIAIYNENLLKPYIEVGDFVVINSTDSKQRQVYLVQEINEDIVKRNTDRDIVYVTSGPRSTPIGTCGITICRKLLEKVDPPKYWVGDQIVHFFCNIRTCGIINKVEISKYSQKYCYYLKDARKTIWMAYEDELNSDKPLTRIFESEKPTTKNLTVFSNSIHPMSDNTQFWCKRVGHEVDFPKLEAKVFADNKHYAEIEFVKDEEVLYKDPCFPDRRRKKYTISEVIRPGRYIISREEDNSIISLAVNADRLKKTK